MVGSAQELNLNRSLLLNREEKHEIQYLSIICFNRRGLFHKLNLEKETKSDKTESSKPKPENKENQNKDESALIEDARNSLLQHFSSKSTNQTAVLMGLAIASFTVIQTYSVLKFQFDFEGVAFLTASLGLIIFLIIRAIGRLVYWGELAGAIHLMQIQDSNEIQQRLNEWLPKQNLKDEKAVHWTVIPTYLERLHIPSVWYVEAAKHDERNRWRASSLIWRITSHKWFGRVYLIAVIGIFVAWWFAWAYLL